MPLGANVRKCHNKLIYFKPRNLISLLSVDKMPLSSINEGQDNRQTAEEMQSRKRAKNNRKHRQTDGDIQSRKRAKTSRKHRQTDEDMQSRKRAKSRKHRITTKERALAKAKASNGKILVCLHGFSLLDFTVLPSGHMLASFLEQGPVLDVITGTELTFKYNGQITTLLQEWQNRHWVPTQLLVAFESFRYGLVA